MSTTATIGTIPLSRILTTQRQVLVEPSPEPNCLLKALGIPSDHFLTIQVYQDYHSGRSFAGFAGLGGYKYRAQGHVYDPRYNHQKTWAREKAHVIIDDNSKIVPKIANDIFFQVGDLEIDLSHANTKKEAQYERNGEFFAKVWNVEIPLSIFKSRKGWRMAEESEALNTVANLIALPGTFEKREELNRYLDTQITTDKLRIEKGEGIQKTLNAIKTFYEAAINKPARDTLSLLAFNVAAAGAKKTLNNVKFSVVFNRIFGEITTQEAFDKAIEAMSKTMIAQTVFYEGGRLFLEKLLDELPTAREVKKEALKRKSTGAFNKIMDDLDFVKINPDTHPITHAAVHNGDILLGTFFRKTGESYFVYNDNWDLWEEMLAKFPDIAREISAEASRRTTYEKDIMSYFYFVLHALPDYLEQQTGKKWTGIPKLVTSANELEPPKEGENGVAKTRSALTPIADNEKCEVTIPYVSMSIGGGYGTTYCYGLDFNVLTKGFTMKGNTITRDVEKKLNGRDDYGLMFYTLTGTAQGRGYPTFLIIFERLENSTCVHFHRTHPMRSKSGDYNPVHAWTIGCYKWMIGNVNFERIKAQQGDLAFVQIDDDKFPTEGITEVNSYDSHCFDVPVKFAPYTKKDNQNVLGYVSLEKDTILNHTHHMNRIIPAGTYEIRQCRSWEANPKGIWSLRID